MKKTFLSISLCMSLLLSACGGEKNVPQGEVPVINVETAIQNPQELLLTDLGEKITYIPLEAWAMVVGRCFINFCLLSIESDVTLRKSKLSGIITFSSFRILSAILCSL